MLMDLTVHDFMDAVAADSPAPGGGSVAACTGACGAALMAMVCRLTLRGREEEGTAMGRLLALAEEKRRELAYLVEEDTAAFHWVMDALRLPKGTPAEKEKRRQALLEATFYAARVPLRTASLCVELLEHIRVLADRGNQNALSDAAVALECLYAACRGACYNVRINLKGLGPSENKDALLHELQEIEGRAANVYHAGRKLLAQKGL
ncbi:cyclodeaminase/cyclohydrolase family protein [Desulfofundulus thermosubterraneus]|uniref:Formiminotetrahydrofolate cyclodeaminase n=1 Tax=Desulfofundulus thermosubterraneus DSM 16057 TaxID=1121432 RepID=A0A1M6H8Y2_9FIRM|nr:cyclodeaminase/cyclohydrolase family protein [Desulfofundulus thermosubterraneus]SHJ18684.1 Formiminotetrahydrofolate cyclodeaminase [Desulfofundulus thermosubterraneus DSM 16057]